MTQTKEKVKIVKKLIFITVGLIVFSGGLFIGDMLPALSMGRIFFSVVSMFGVAAMMAGGLSLIEGDKNDTIGI
jgi:uncharacterized membrane protein YiaA